MRYYDIKITKAGGGQPITYTSFVNGQTNLNALNVVLDIPVIGQATPMGAAYVQIWGIPLSDISQANNLKNATIEIRGGMQKGLPLANPAQAGLLVKGFIQQAYGNWINTDQTLDLIILPGPGPATATAQPAPKNIVLNWTAGTPLGTALTSTLQTAFPGLKQNINISPNLVLAHDEPGFYGNLNQLAAYVKRISQSIIGGTYPGADMLIQQDQIVVYDGTPAASGAKQPTKIAYQDLIGQPTWIEAPAIQYKCVMRADMQVGDECTLPPTVVTNTQQAASSLVNQSANFQGTFQVSQLRHIGNFRQPDAASWVSVITAFPTSVH